MHIAGPVEKLLAGENGPQKAIDWSCRLNMLNMLRLSNIITVKAGVSFASCQCSPDRRARNVSSNVESECDFGQFGRNTSANCETWSSVEKEKCSIALTLQCLEWSRRSSLTLRLCREGWTGGRPLLALYVKLSLAPIHYRARSWTGYKYPCWSRWCGPTGIRTILPASEAYRLSYN